jgi:FkbM family methyltransferase
VQQTAAPQPSRNPVTSTIRKTANFIRSLVAPETRIVRQPDRGLMMRYGAARLKAGGVYVEIGAGAGGNATILFDENGLDHAKGHLIEACPANFAVISKRTTGFKLHNIAISATNGDIPFFVMDKEGWEGSSLSNSTDISYMRKKFPNAEIREIRVPAKRFGTFLDDAGIDRVDFAVFNCEGSEYDIFAGDLSFLRRIEVLYLDLHGKIALTPEIVAKKRDILERVQKEGMQLIGGSRPSEVDTAGGHLTFLFERAA